MYTALKAQVNIVAYASGLRVYLRGSYKNGDTAVYYGLKLGK